VNVTSVQLLEPSDGSVLRELWLSREHAVCSVIIAEHGNARGVVQFSIARVSVSHFICYADNFHQITVVSC